MGKYSTEQIEHYITQTAKDFVEVIAAGPDNLGYLISEFEGLFYFVSLYPEGSMDNYDQVIATFCTTLFSSDENGVLLNSDFTSEQFHKAYEMLEGLSREYSSSLALGERIQLLQNWLIDCLVLFGENSPLAVAMIELLNDPNQKE